MADTTTPQPQPVSHGMTADEFANLRAMVAKVNDNALQPLLREIVNFIGHAHGLDATEEDKRLADEAKKRADDEDKAAQKQNDDDTAAADAKLAQAKKDMYVAMFGDTTSAPHATPDAKPAPVATTTAKPDPKPTPAPDAAKGA